MSFLFGKRKSPAEISEKSVGIVRDLVLAACGLEHRSKVAIVDIDATDFENELAAMEYIEDIYNFYKETETFDDYVVGKEDAPGIIVLQEWWFSKNDAVTLMSQQCHCIYN